MIMELSIFLVVVINTLTRILVYPAEQSVLIPLHSEQVISSDSPTLSSPAFPSPPVPCASQDPTRIKRQNGNNDSNGSGIQIAGNPNATISVGGPTSTSSSSGGGGGLSTSDQIAVGASVGGGVLTIIGIIVAIYYGRKTLRKRKERRHQKEQESLQSRQYNQSQPSEHKQPSTSFSYHPPSPPVQEHQRQPQPAQGYPRQQRDRDMNRTPQLPAEPVQGYHRQQRDWDMNQIPQLPTEPAQGYQRQQRDWDQIPQLPT